MFQTYTYQKFEYKQSVEQTTQTVKRHPVVIIGAGPVGLTQALDLAHRGVSSIILDDDNTVSIGSRAVCYAKRPLEILDRLGVGEEFANKGVQWNVGKVFFREDLAYQFNLLPEDDHKMPAMINYQQYHLEERLIRACEETGLVDIRWKSKVLSLQQFDNYANLNVETPDGIYKIEAQWVIACDGANSTVRGMVGADFTGQFFQDRFLIADVVMKADFLLSAGSGLIRNSTGTKVCCFTNKLIMCGVLIFNLAGTLIQLKKRNLKTLFHAFKQCSEKMWKLSWNGFRFINSPAVALTNFATTE